MWFLDSLIGWFGKLSEWFYTAYQEVNGWIVPFRYLATPLYWLYDAAWWVTYYFGWFNDWVSDIAAKVVNFLSGSEIWDMLATPINYAFKAWWWIEDAWGTVSGWIDVWWENTQLTVETWISTASNALSLLIGNLSTLHNTLRTEWDAFWSYTLPTLLSWSDMTSFVYSTLLAWFPFYNTLVAIWSDIESFFADPSDWIYNKLEDFFERYW